MKLRRPGHEWLAYIELVKFVETMLLTAFGVLAPEPWRGVIRMRERLPEAAVGQLRAVLPSAPEEAELRRERTAGGAALIGWKAGLNAPGPREKLGLTRPLVGFLTDRTLVRSGAEVSAAGWENPTLEPEIAMRLGRDVPGGASRDDVAAAVDALAPAIELVDLSGPSDDVEEMLATNIFHRAVVLGDWDEGRAGARLDGIALDVEGHDVAGADPTGVLGDLVEVVRGVADTLADAGETLRADQLVICGSVVAAFRVAPGQRVRCSFSALGDVEVALVA